MAKQNNTEFRSFGYIVIAIALAVIMTLNMTLLYFNYAAAHRTFKNTSNEMNLINSANNMLSQANTELSDMIAGIGSTKGHMTAITTLLPACQAKMDAYEKIGAHNELAIRRFRHARAYLDAYAVKMNEYNDELTAILKTGDDSKIEEFQNTLKDVYEQEIAPLQTAAAEMMVSSITIGTNDANKRTDDAARNMYLILAVLAAILIIGEIAVFLAARYNKRASEEISRKSAQFADASSKLMRSREKMEDIAVSNILTGLKNRYALEQDIGERLSTEQFNIAVFDLDNFRSINDTYGYDFGDEYLAQMAERLREEFDQFADIYNITGNEFCFVFKRTVSDTQVIRLVENIVNVMTSPYTILNLTVQLTVSGSTYHYLAGDCLNVNSLLVKMDNVLRNAKRAGGGQIFQVMNI